MSPEGKTFVICLSDEPRSRDRTQSCPCVVKCPAGFVGDSFALISDGIESLSDVVSSSVVYFGLRFAIKPPDKEGNGWDSEYCRWRSQLLS